MGILIMKTLTLNILVILRQFALCNFQKNKQLDTLDHGNFTSIITTPWFDCGNSLIWPWSDWVLTTKGPLGV